MTNVVPISAARPSPVQLRSYAEAQARRLLRSAGLPTHRRTVTVAFIPRARTNLEAVSEWIYRHVLKLGHLRALTLEGDTLLQGKLRIAFYEKLERTFDDSIFD